MQDYKMKPIEFREMLDDAISAGRAKRLIGRAIYHGALRSGYGTIVKLPTGYYIAGYTKCTHKGCKRYRKVYFGSGCHHGAFCYAYNRAGVYLGDFRNVEYRCKEHYEKG